MAENLRCEEQLPTTFGEEDVNSMLRHSPPFTALPFPFQPMNVIPQVTDIFSDQVVTPHMLAYRLPVFVHAQEALSPATTTSSTASEMDEEPDLIEAHQKKRASEGNNSKTPVSDDTMRSIVRATHSVHPVSKVSRVFYRHRGIKYDYPKVPLSYKKEKKESLAEECSRILLEKQTQMDKSLAFVHLSSDLLCGVISNGWRNALTSAAMLTVHIQELVNEGELSPVGTYQLYYNQLLLAFAPFNNEERFTTLPEDTPEKFSKKAKLLDIALSREDTGSVITHVMSVFGIRRILPSSSKHNSHGTFIQNGVTIDALRIMVHSDRPPEWFMPKDERTGVPLREWDVILKHGRVNPHSTSGIFPPYRFYNDISLVSVAHHYGLEDVLASLMVLNNGHYRKGVKFPFCLYEQCDSPQEFVNVVLLLRIPLRSPGAYCHILLLFL